MLISKTDIAAYTGKTYSTAHQTELDRLCQAVQTAFENETGRFFAEEATTEITEYLNGPLTRISPKYFPISAIVSLQEKNDWDASYVDYEYEYALTDDNKVIQVQGSVGYATIPNSIKLVYKAAQIPADVKQAFIEWVLLIWNARFNSGKQTSQEQKGTQTETYYSIDNLPANIKSVLMRYKRFYV